MTETDSRIASPTTARSWLTTFVVLAIGAAALVMMVVSKDATKLVLQEDAEVEWITVWAFVGAAIAYATAARAADARWTRVVFIALAAFCVFVAGEEVSWGQRLFWFQPPKFFLESNFQQESNLHNLLKGIFDSRWQVLLIAFGYASTWVGAKLGWLPKAWTPAATSMPILLLVGVLELTYPVDLTGEIAEALLGLAFLNDALRKCDWEDRRATNQVTATTIGVVMLGWLTPPLLDATILRPNPEDVQLARSELEVLAQRLATTIHPRTFRRRRVHKRIFTAAKSGYFPLAALQGSAPPGDRRAEYGLDPWQQPYWLLVVHNPRNQKPDLMLYSFGPNRRRDTIVRRIPKTMGRDDIAVRFSVGRTPRR